MRNHHKEKKSKKIKKVVDKRNTLIYNNYCRCERETKQADDKSYRGVAQFG